MKKHIYTIVDTNGHIFSVEGHSHRISGSKLSILNENGDTIQFFSHVDRYSSQEKELSKSEIIEDLKERIKSLEAREKFLEDKFKKISDIYWTHNSFGKRGAGFKLIYNEI